MKRNIMKNLTITALMLVFAIVITSCGNSKGENQKEQTVQNDQNENANANDKNAEKAEEPTDSSEKDVMNESDGMVNPWFECTIEEAEKACPHLFATPDGAESISWSIMNRNGKPEKGSLVQLQFTLDGNKYCARAQYGVDEKADIHGMYYEWDATDEDITLTNWGKGDMRAKSYRAIEDDGMVDLITWYDTDNSISYSLTVSAKDLDGFDIRAIVEQMAEGR